ncbi:hypothetical protein GALMADRAFT_149221 [Galerina marginata CBS 339.88]|uniref:Uncharacterized protein n=1 Tax=Galerina marginata (strain CBS 339.88) TaxID=685588 RepID=A0A067S4S1_GALM3|nr:hypothetical protein GALMADRAFT_149221 [Galerina marginata CBS 339.88]
MSGQSGRLANTNPRSKARSNLLIPEPDPNPSASSESFQQRSLCARPLLGGTDHLTAESEERRPPTLRQSHLRANPKAAQRSPGSRSCCTLSAFQTRRPLPDPDPTQEPSRHPHFDDPKPDQREKDRCGDKAPNRSPRPKPRRPRKPKTPLPLEMWADP